MFEEIYNSLIRTLWVMAWSSWTEESGKREGSWAGMNLMDLAPPVPEDCKHASHHFFNSLNNLNFGLSNKLNQILEKNNVSQENLGYYLAMEATGTGVAFTDDYKDHGLIVPRMEVYYYEGDDGELHFTYSI